MESDLSRRQQQGLLHAPQPMNSGLTRYRSAPSSYFANFLNDGGYGGGEDLEQLLNPRAWSPETDRILRRFVSGAGAEESPLSYNQIGGKNDPRREKVQLQFDGKMKDAAAEFLYRPPPRPPPLQRQDDDFSTVSQVIYQQGHSRPNQNPLARNSALDESYGMAGSTPTDCPAQMKTGGASNSNSSLVRHSSSPAGFLSHLHVKDGRMRTKMEYASGLPPSLSLSANSSARMLCQITESGGENVSAEEASFSQGRGGERMTGFSITCWDDDPAIMSDKFLKGFGDGDEQKVFSNPNQSETNQTGESGSRPTTLLSHHLSLPSGSAAMEKLLQFQDMVPCQMRAKRGCATHPRSIAERVRRTRISERMRKLQELVPNMDKQTNTADMLDLAADYIKELQKQVKALSANRASCKCSNKQSP